MSAVNNPYPRHLSAFRPTKGALLLFVAGVAALAAGGWIYVAARPGTLIFSLFHECMAPAITVNLPDFVLYSLPDGLWTLSSILILHPLLRHEALLRRLAVISVVPFLGLGSEILQGAGWLPGVFDICDLACYALPWMSYLIYLLFQTTSFLHYENLQENPLHYL